MSSSTPSTTTTTTTALTTAAPTSYNRIVRFDQECVLIPDPQPSKRALMSTKSYCLPLWKKRASLATGDSDSNDDSSSTPQPDDSTHVVIKVPIPIFNMPTRAPTRGRTSNTLAQPLSPCLVQRSPSSSESPQIDGSPFRSRPAPARRTSLPPPGVYHNHKTRSGSALTIPLRECCTDCIAITEQSLMDGEDWKEKFTRAAKRRRSASLDSTMNPTVQAAATANSGTFENIVHPNSRFSSSTTAMTAASTSTSTNRVMQPASPIVPPFSPGLFITVDEVEKRRKTSEKHEKPDSLSSSLHRLRIPLERDSSASSEELLTPVDSIPSHHLTRKASPIFEEEDEDELFPLPSPRRSPNSSPVHSWGGSPTTSLNSSPIPSPNASSSCLGLPPRCSGNGSKDSLTCVGKCLSKRCKAKYLSPESASSLPPKLRTTSTSSSTLSSSSASSLSAPSSPVAPASLVISSAAAPPSEVSVGSGPHSGSTASLPNQQQESREEHRMPPLINTKDVSPSMEEYPEPPSPVVLHSSSDSKERALTPELEPVSVAVPPIPSTQNASSSLSASLPQRSASPFSSSSPYAAMSSTSPSKSKRASLSFPIQTAHHSRSSSALEDIPPSSSQHTLASPTGTGFLSKLMTQPQSGQGQGRSISPSLVPAVPASPTTPTHQATFPAASSSFGSISRSGSASTSSPPRRATANNGNGSSNEDRGQHGKRASFSIASLPINIPGLSKSKGGSFLKVGADVLRGISASGGGLGVSGTGFGSP